jgi:hypothetical protein
MAGGLVTSVGGPCKFLETCFYRLHELDRSNMPGVAVEAPLQQERPSAERISSLRCPRLTEFYYNRGKNKVAPLIICLFMILLEYDGLI